MNSKDIASEVGSSPVDVPVGDEEAAAVRSSRYCIICFAYHTLI